MNLLVKAAIGAVIIAWSSTSVFGQLGVSVSNNANNLAQNLVGSGVIVTNAQLFCGFGAAGFFDGVNSNIGIDSGIILSSGLIINAVGPNISPGGNYDNMNQPGDPLLTQISGQQTYDRCELRFNVTPFSDTMTFRYSFGSEEYPEYVCSNFNDVFGFFISGPNPLGGNYIDYNAALIPGTNIAVAINSVNAGVPGPNYPSSGCISLSYPQYYYDNTGGATVEYDGFTSRLQAVVPVVACSTYSMRLMIADAGDAVWNSGVFLEAGSLSSQAASVIAQTTVGSAYTNMIEGCLDGELVFSRNSSNNSSPMTINITVGGTATNCIDYNCIPSSIIIPSGQDSIVFPLTAYADGIPEGFESLIVYIAMPCGQGILDSAIIYISDSLVIDILPGDTSLCLGNNLQLQAVGGGNFNWTPPTGLNFTFISTPTATPLVTTTYTVSGSIATCSATNTITVTVIDTPNISAGPDITLCDGSSHTMSASGVANQYLWAPTQNVSNPGILNPTVTPASTTMYTLTATNGGLCSMVDSVLVTVAPLPLVSGVPNQTICLGDSVQLNATGASTYVWTPSTGLSDPNIANPWASPTSPITNYMLTGTDSNGCSRSTIVRVTVLPKPNVNAGLNTSICIGDTVSLWATGAVSYAWQPATSISDTAVANPNVWPTGTTTYFVTGTGSNGCKAMDSVTIAIWPLPQISATSAPAQVCHGDTVQLQANGGVTYSWSPASAVINPLISNPIAIINSNTTFTVTGTDANGCVDTTTVQVSVFTPPTPTIGGRDSICIGETVQLSASGGTTYLWAPAASLSDPNILNPIASPASTTTYTLFVRDANGCSGTDQFTITILPLPLPSAGPPLTLCEGAPTPLLATGGTQYQWSPTAGLSCSNCPNPTLIPSASTVYTVDVTDQFGCEGTTSLSVTVTPLPPTTISASPVSVCPGDTVQLSIIGGISWQWSPAATLMNANTANPIAIPPASLWYFVNTTDITGCVKRDSIEVIVFNVGILHAGNDTAVCIGESVPLAASGATTYSWSPVAGLSNPAIANPIATPSSTTTYTLTGTVANHCSHDTTITITVNPLPLANAGSDHSVCPGSLVQLSGSGGISYQWSPTTGLSCTGCPGPQLVAVANRSYVLRVSDANGCVAFDTVEVILLPLPTVRANRDTTICTSTSVQLSASGASSYQWQPATALNNSAIANPLCTPSTQITYTVTGTGANSCTSTDSVTVRLHPVVPVVAGPGGSICGNDTIRLQASNAQAYEWAPIALVDDATLASPLATPGTTTTFTVTGRDQHTCPTYDTVTVVVYPTPNIALNITDTILCPDMPLQIIASGASNYSWTPAFGLSDPTIANPIAQPTAPVVYTVTSTDPTSGCMDSATVTIDIYPYSYPNAQPPLATICPGDEVQLSAENGVNYNWAPSAGLDDPNIDQPLASPGVSTVYTVTITDINGCEFSEEVDITVYPAAIANAGPDKLVQHGKVAVLDGYGNGAILWTPAMWLSDPAVADPTTRPDSSITYYITVTTPDGCTATDSVFVRVYFPTQVIVPNAFSPNGDGQNDVFHPNSWHEFEMELFQVFDRWGQIVYSTTDPNGFWDGTLAGQPAQLGVYVYIIRGRGNQGEPILMQGNVTLVR